MNETPSKPGQQAAGQHYSLHGEQQQQQQPPPLVAASSHAAAPLPVPGAPALPPGWVAIVDPSTGRTYYGNPLTGDTSWEVPSLPPPPPTAPAQQQPAPAQSQFVYHAVGSTMPTAPGVGHVGTISQTSMAPVSAQATVPAAMNYLVPQVRSMMDAEQTTRAALSSASKSPLPLELAGLTAGAVADLVNVKHEQSLAAGEEAVPYEPIEPYSLPVLAKPPHIEPGRVEIRANLLYEKLEKL